MVADRDSDEWLMRQVAEGNRDHLETLVRRYASPLLTFIRRMIGGSPERSEELFQEVFLKVWRKRFQYQYPRAFKPWLYKITVNCCRADFRAAEGRTTIPVDESVDPPSSDPSPTDVAVARETAIHVLAAVQRLPEQQRMVAVLRIWNDMSFAQIADVMDRSESTARSTMHHALRNMRRYLEPRLR